MTRLDRIKAWMCKVQETNSGCCAFELDTSTPPRSWRIRRAGLIFCAHDLERLVVEEVARELEVQANYLDAAERAVQEQHAGATDMRVVRSVAFVLRDRAEALRRSAIGVGARM